MEVVVEDVEAGAVLVVVAMVETLVVAVGESSGGGG